MFYFIIISLLQNTLTQKVLKKVTRILILFLKQKVRIEFS